MVVTEMKAIINNKYGSPENLKLEEIEKPVINDDSVLVRVRAASVNPLDWHFVRGLPYFVRVMGGPAETKANRTAASTWQASSRRSART